MCALRHLVRPQRAFYLLFFLSGVVDRPISYCIRHATTVLVPDMPYRMWRSVRLTAATEVRVCPASGKPSVGLIRSCPPCRGVSSYKECQNVLQSDTMEQNTEQSRLNQSFSETPVVATDDLSASPADLQEQLRRLQADFANFRRRGADIADRAAHDRAVQIVTLLLPVIDNFERALETETTDAAYAEGVRLTFRHLTSTLANIGVEPIPAAGEAFDPRVHEAVRRLETDTVPEGIVVEVHQKGYRLNGTLLRPAQVSVAASPRHA